MDTVIKIKNLYKEYRLGSIGYGTLSQDLQSLWAKLKGLPDPNSILDSENFSSDMNKVLALNNINLEVQKGDRIGIIGKNGAGKTTLLKILSQISSPSSGEIMAKGRISSLIAVGTGFHKELTGRENIFLNGAILGLTKKEISSRLDEIIDFSGVEQFIDTPVKRYSTGMNIRLGFAVAAPLDPDIFIIDEVLAVGDAEFQRKCISSLNNISGDGKTIIVVSHNLGMIRNLCKKVIVLESGKIIFSGNVEEGISYYLSSLAKNNNQIEKKDQLSRYINTNPSIIKSISLRKKNGEEGNYFFQNESFYIDLKYENNLQIPLSGAGFIIKSNDGMDIGESNTYMSYPPPYKLPESGLITWEVSAKVFNPGIYTLKIFVCGDISRQVDAIENVFEFKINSSDIHKTQYDTENSAGFMTLQPRIEIVANTSG